MSDGIWDCLMIAATRDETRIRRAYAARLKQIDPQAEPAAFIALRQAFEQARALAGASARVAVATPSEKLTPIARVEMNAPAARMSVEAPPAWVAEADAIQRLVWRDIPRSATWDELIERTRRIVQDPAMDSIDHAATMERWSIDIVINGMPRSDAVLIVAAEHFGWVAMADRWDCPPVIRQMLQRYWDIGWVQSLEREHHVDIRYDAGRALELLRDATAQPGGAVTGLVANLLAEIRSDHPTAIHDVSPEAVEKWDDYLARRDARWHRRAGKWLCDHSPAAW